VGNGGYYGCLAATKGACENKTLVRRTPAEKVILGAVQDQISDPAQIAYVLKCWNSARHDQRRRSAASSDRSRFNL
jgi:hypothetical protein